MQLGSQFALIGAMVQMCGSTAPSHDYSNGFSCDDYQLMVDVELMVGLECSVDTECTQVLAEDRCESNSVLVNSSYVSENLYQIIDLAEADGCSVELPRNEDCAATTAVCSSGECGWE